MKKFSIRTAGRSLFLSLIAITFLAFGQPSARADEVTISGSTTGTVSGIPRLTFTGSPGFTGTTTMGIGSLIGLNNNLGTFSLSIAGLGQAQSVAGSFTLNITFTGPSGIADGQGRSFNANLTGTISPFSGFEGVLIDFDKYARTLHLQRRAEQRFVHPGLAGRVDTIRRLGWSDYGAHHRLADLNPRTGHTLPPRHRPDRRRCGCADEALSASREKINWEDRYAQ